MNTMVNGSDPNFKGGGNYTNYTGLSIARPVAVNPSNEDYERITGSKCPYPLVYDYVEFGENKDKYMPILILMENQETGKYNFIRFNISDRIDTSSKGSIRFMNKVGATTWASSPEILSGNSKMGWFTSSPFEPLCEGMNTLYNFLQALTVYNSKNPEATWLSDMKATDVTPEALYSRADVSGLRTLIEWCNKQDHSVVVLYSVRETEKDGNTYFNQHIESGNGNRNLFYKSVRTPEHSISKYCKDAFRKLDKETSEQGYSITNRHYTTDFQEFVAPEVENTDAMVAPPLSDALESVV